MSDPKLITLGCRLNTYESEVMRRHAQGAGLGDAVIVNTCAVTQEAVRSSRRAIRRAAKANPGAPVIATGCAAQIEPERFAEMPEVTRVIDNHAKMNAATWAPAALLDEARPKVQVNDIMSVRETAAHLIDGMEGRARAYVQVQQGCDHRCTFCVIPYGRGNSRSVPAGDVVAQVRALAESGHGEVVLTGVDLTSWGADLPGQPSLGTLVQRILRLVPALPQLRISSIDAIEIDDALFEAMAEPRLAPFMHLSLQHGDTLILKRMKRRHARDDAVALAERLRAVRPEMALGADLIAGFPTESEAAFAATLALIEDCGLNFVHVFPYSPRPGTPAARMPQVAGPVIKARAARLREAAARAFTRHLDTKIGRVERALVEAGGRARLADFTPARLEASADLAPGTRVDLKVTGHDGAALIGVVQ
ncbi:MAG: tRNA (N(6)-L-threonylcarbamoyladenosine(37)-C(2))-methylthiotransferase MtaB [Pseudomonadota bacterium]